MDRYLNKTGLTKYTTKLKEYISKAKVASAASADSANSVDWSNVSGKPTLGNAASKTTRGLNEVGTCGWAGGEIDKDYVPDMTFMAWWNGAYSETASNLTYCNKGAFGTAATANKEDFATASHTHSNYLSTSNPTGTGTFSLNRKADTTIGLNSHAEGYYTTASNLASHAEGNQTTSSGNSSHAEGGYTTASNIASHASGKYNVGMTTGGKYNNTIGTAFVIGNGTSPSALSNAFSVQYDGTVKAQSTITASTTADYAEFFEWLDGNPNAEDRVGYFVTLDGNRIRIATESDDYILGVVSGEPFVLGNGDCDTWNGMYLHDEFRRTIYEPAPKMEQVEVKEIQEEVYIDKETGEEKTREVEVVKGIEFKEVEGEYEGTRPVLNPKYDSAQQYISRFDRPEWAAVGMLGVLPVRHDGTAQVNGYVTVGKNGIATACERTAENAYRVINENSDSVVEIIFR